MADAAGGLQLPKVERTLVASGEWFTIECAVRADLSSPAGEFLIALESGTWATRDEALQEPDEQISWRSWFVAACEFLAETGWPPHGNPYNQLQDGIWELKHQVLRVPFYDTDGCGNSTPKIDYDSYSRFTTRPWPEDFDEFLRLTTAFEKTTQKTDPREIQLALTIREEDLDHDRPG